MNPKQIQLGILGAGQLGKMLAQSSSRWALPLTLLDRSRDFPGGYLAQEFIEGDFTKKEHVQKILQHCTHATIEIEKVNLEGLRYLQDHGVIVHPDPEALVSIVDKGLQKQFYDEYDIPTAPYLLIDSEEELRSAIESSRIAFPFVLKSRRGGYDGRGVQVIRDAQQLNDLISGPFLVEEMMEIDKELAVIAVANPRGECQSFPAVEMVFDPEANLVDYLFCPSDIPSEVESLASELAQKLIRAFGISGLLAVEMFYTTDGRLYVNEVAPRPHNSGHHTIEACNYSQFEMHLRGVLDWPLPEIKLLRPAAMINLLGSKGSGRAQVIGLRETLEIPEVYVHLYGKSDSRPQRKMGHITILGDDRDEILVKMAKVRELIRVEGV